jgi:putative spermidine/putrescine transport system ATP-binding protein
VPRGSSKRSASAGWQPALCAASPAASSSGSRSPRRLIVRAQTERALTTLIITHDRTEAAELAESLALMLEGRIVQQDDPRELFERPRSAAVARFFGAANILRGTVLDGLLHLPDGTTIPVDGADGPAAYVVRPEALRISDDGPLRAHVTEAVYAGTFVRVSLQRGDQRIEVLVPLGTRISPGEDVGVETPAERLWRLPGTAQQGIREAGPAASGERE